MISEPPCAAALWCFHRTSTFEDAALTAANLGEDADTTAAICGQIAGAFYGVEGIPERWLRLLARRELIEGLADRLEVLNRTLRTDPPPGAGRAPGIRS
ncbi:MAG: ADP-ribosylglycohydrolase family protein [Longimicrobiales bacterium]|nr:ADP-ribosylglycohydrolase family protein [Longimicrobiales bacterium]